MRILALILSCLCLTCSSDSFIVITLTPAADVRSIEVLVQFAQAVDLQEHRLTLASGREAGPYDFALRLRSDLIGQSIVVHLATLDGAGCLLDVGESTVKVQPNTNGAAHQHVTLARPLSAPICPGTAPVLFPDPSLRVETMTGGTVELHGWGFRPEDPIWLDGLIANDFQWQSPQRILVSIPPRPRHPGPIPVSILSVSTGRHSTTHIRYYASAPISFESVTLPYFADEVRVCDSDGDGFVDVIASYDSEIYVYKNSGRRFKTAEERIPIITSFSSEPGWLGGWKCDDVNKDRYADLIGYRNGSDEIHLLLGANNGVFRRQAIYKSPQKFDVSQRQALFVEDVNDDGQNDLVVQPSISPFDLASISLLLSVAPGIWSAARPATNAATRLEGLARLSPLEPISLLLGGPAVVINQGNGLFLPEPIWPLPSFDKTSQQLGTAFTDLDMDGQIDMIVPSVNPLFFRGAGGTRFSPVQNQDVVDFFFGTADVDGDAIPDLVGSNRLWCNQLGFRFQECGRFTLKGDERIAASADLDLDGRPDIVLLSSGTVEILYSEAQ